MSEKLGYNPDEEANKIMTDTQAELSRRQEGKVDVSYIEDATDEGDIQMGSAEINGLPVRWTGNLEGDVSISVDNEDLQEADKEKFLVKYGDMLKKANSDLEYKAKGESKERVVEAEVMRKKDEEVRKAEEAKEREVASRRTDEEKIKSIREKLGLV